jgi:hypothetical protein
MKRVNGLTLCLCSVLGACAGDGEGLDQNGRPQGEDDGTLTADFESIQRNVLTPICTTCHAGAAAPLGLRLDADSSYALLVNAPSVEVPSLLRVQPGNPDLSYLVQKIEGTAAVGGRMPLNGPPLPPASIAVIRQWIANGALASAADALAKNTAVADLVAIAPHADELRAGPPQDIVLQSRAALDLSLLQSGPMLLRASGGDGTFEDGNEHDVDFHVTVRSQQPTVLALKLDRAGLKSDDFELRVSGSPPFALADTESHPIDGNHDGVAGGDFVLHFRVEISP